MSGNVFENNLVTLAGKVEEAPVYSHEIYGEGFYSFQMSVLRLSDCYDFIPILVSERLVSPSDLVPGTRLKLEGQFRSYNNKDNSDHKLLLTVFAREVFLLSDDEEDPRNPNLIELNGFICKKPIFRTTPSGREISDMLLAVNRSYNKSDYIPCIAWGRNARYSESLKIGDNLKVWGRIQSREYQKKLETGVITKVAYEISVSKLLVQANNENTNEAE